MKTKLTEQENYQKASELQRLAEEWVNKTFNFIQVDVLNKCCDNMLFEYIRPEEPDYEEFISNYSLEDEFYQYLIDNDILKDNNIKITVDEVNNFELFDQYMIDFCEQNFNFDNWKAERENENYPMWNTCFEFRYKPTEEILTACINAGFGIIEGMEDFNTLLFVAGAGYSFYGQHWIPAFLNMPWNDQLKQEYKDINYRMV